MTSQSADGRWGSYADFFQQATGNPPYPYQVRLGADGLPELLVVDTGAGKTAAVIVAWLWHLVCTFENGRGVPRRLVYVLPLRTLVDQVTVRAKEFVANLGLTEDVAVHLLMGGEGPAANAWRDAPAQAAVFVGTQDMLLSRALMRSYGSSRYVAPIDFGMFNNGAHWIFDEVQLMGAALPTSRQLQGLRQALGVAQPTTTTWMSATVHKDRLRTIDNPDVATEECVQGDDRQGALGKLLQATRRIRRLQVDPKAYEQHLADALVESHRPGRRTIAVLNTVKRATDVYRRLTRSVGDDVNVVLLHSRFRPGDRGRHMTTAVEDDQMPPGGTIVVATQVLEAGVDVTSSLLLTEAAPWSSVVQRAGRCNRHGGDEDATILWTEPPSAAPYDQADIDATVAALSDLDSLDVTTTALTSRHVAERRPEHAVLRRRDLIDLFDTTPDLSGNEIDVSRFIRDQQDLDVEVFWRTVPVDGRDLQQRPPGQDELCRVPVGDLRQYVTGANARRAWHFNPLSSTWERVSGADVRPGRVLLLDAKEGGYDSELGWAPRSRTVVITFEPPELDPQTRADDSAGDDYGTTTGRWLALVEHLADTERCYGELATSLGAMPGLTREHLQAACVSARLHDIGKAHPCFQRSLRKVSPGPPESADGPWAKSGGRGRLHHERRYFRHELVGALMLLDPAAASLLEEVPEQHRSLTIYLVAAHHGKVRLGIRTLPDETRPPESDRRHALGVWEGDRVPPVVVPGGKIASTTLSLDCMALGSAGEGDVSWTSMALALRDDRDLGPFRLAFLEVLVRLADWEASAAAGGPR